MTGVSAWTTGDPSPVLGCIVCGNADSIHSQRRTNLWGPRTMELVLLSQGCTRDWWSSWSSKAAHPAWCWDCLCMERLWLSWHWSWRREPQPALLSLTLQQVGHIPLTDGQTALGEPCLVWGQVLPGAISHHGTAAHPSARSTAWHCSLCRDRWSLWSSKSDFINMNLT